MSVRASKVLGSSRLAKKRFKVAYSIDNRYLTDEQSQFVDLVNEDLNDFHDQASSEIVLLFPPVDSFLRLLIHKSVEEFHDLHSFSVGQGEGRQTVVCLKTACIERDSNQFGSVDHIGPWTMRGRGRARYRDQDSPNPGNNTGSGDRWTHDQYQSASPPPPTQSRCSYGDTQPARNQPGQSVPSTQAYTSKERYTSDRLHDDRTQSPSIGLSNNVKTQALSGGPSDRAMTQSPTEGPSRVRKNDRSKNRRPDVQVYVPRARRQHHGGQTDQHTSEPDRSPVVANRLPQKTRQKKPEMERYVPRLPKIALQNNQNLTTDATFANHKDSRTANATSTNHHDSTTDTVSTYDDSSGYTYRPDEYDPCDNRINPVGGQDHMDNDTRVIEESETGQHVQHNQVVTHISDPNAMDVKLKDYSASITDKHNSTNLGQQSKESNTKEQTSSNLCKENLEQKTAEQILAELCKQNIEGNAGETLKSDDSAKGASGNLINKISMNASIMKSDGRTENVTDVKDEKINKNLSLPPDKERTLCDKVEHYENDSSETNTEPNAACDNSDQEHSELVIETDQNQDSSTADNGCIEIMNSPDVSMKQVHSNSSEDIYKDVDNSDTDDVVVDLGGLEKETLDKSDKTSKCNNESQLTQGSNPADAGPGKSCSELVDSSVDKVSDDEIVDLDQDQTYQTNKLDDLTVEQPGFESDSCESKTPECMSEKNQASNSTSYPKDSNDSNMIKMTQETIIVNDNSADAEQEVQDTAVTMETVEDEFDNERNIGDYKDLKRTDEEDDTIVDVPTNKTLAERGKVDSYVEDSKGFTEEMEMERNDDSTKLHQSEADDVDEDSQSQHVTINSNQSETEEVDEDSWDAMFDDDGECLDPSAMDELTKTVGKVKIQKSKKINYLEYQPKDKTDFDYTQYEHIIEIYNFPAEFVTRDLIMAFQSFMSRGFDLKWVDDTHALGIFSSAIAAQDALGMVHPLLKVCPLSQASKQSKMKARRCTEFLQPYKPRPETSAAAARRLVAGALGLASNVSREKREAERQQLKEAKAKRRKDRQNRVDIWEFGGKCAMDEES